MNLQSLKVFLITFFTLSSTFAFERNFMIDNDSSCMLKFQPGLSKTFAPNTPDQINAHTQTPIKYNVSRESMNMTLLKYNIYCGSYISGMIDVTTKGSGDEYSISERATSYDAKLKMKIDKDNNIHITYA